MTTSLAPAVPASAVTGPAGTTGRGVRGAVRDHALAAVLYAVAGLGVMGHLLRGPGGRVLVDNRNDQAYYEWLLANAAHHRSAPPAVWWLPANGINPLDAAAAPGLTLPLTWVTRLLGAPTTFALATAGCLALTAFCWYLLLRYRAVSSRAAAIIGGGVAGFAPGMVSQATGHLQIVAQFLVPLIVWQVLRLLRTSQPGRDGALLGALVTWQVLISESVFLVTAVGLGAYLAGLALCSPRYRRRPPAGVLRGIVTAAVVAAVLLSYPLCLQTFGPKVPVVALPGSTTDLAAYGSFASNSLVRSPVGSLPYGRVAEENAYLGWPLLVLVLLLVVWLRQQLVVRAATVAGGLLAVLSLGAAPTLFGHHSPLPGPWRVPAALPGLDGFLPGRFALGVIPIVGLLLALGTDRVLRLRAEVPGVPLRAAWYAVVAVALVPIVPTPLPVVGDQPPAFIADGTWREYVRDGGTLVPVPLPSPGYSYAVRWSARSGLGVALPPGYLPAPGGVGLRSPATTRPTATLLASAASTGVRAPVAATDRAALRADLQYWHASALMLPDIGTAGITAPVEEALWVTVTDLVGALPVWVDGVWLWSVRSVTGP